MEAIAVSVLVSARIWFGHYDLNMLMLPTVCGSCSMERRAPPRFQHSPANQIFFFLSGKVAQTSIHTHINEALAQHCIACKHPHIHIRTLRVPSLQPDLLISVLMFVMFEHAES